MEERLLSHLNGRCDRQGENTNGNNADFLFWCGREHSHIGRDQRLTEGAGRNSLFERKRGFLPYPHRADWQGRKPSAWGVHLFANAARARAKDEPPAPSARSTARRQRIVAVCRS